MYWGAPPPRLKHRLRMTSQKHTELFSLGTFAHLNPIATITLSHLPQGRPSRQDPSSEASSKVDCGRRVMPCCSPSALTGSKGSRLLRCEADDRRRASHSHRRNVPDFDKLAQSCARDVTVQDSSLAHCSRRRRRRSLSALHLRLTSPAQVRNTTAPAAAAAAP